MALGKVAEIDGVTVGGTELSIHSGTTSLQTRTEDGLYYVIVDPVTNMAKGDHFILRAYEKVEDTGGTKREIWRQTISHAQTKLIITPLFGFMFGWDFTLQKLAGTDRAFDATIGSIGTPTQSWELDNVSVGTSELSLISGTTTLQTNTTAGIYQVLLDPVGAALAKGDKFTFRIYEKAEDTGGTKRVVFEDVIEHAQFSNIVYPALPLQFGFDFTLQKTAGTDRNWDASVRKVS